MRRQSKIQITIRNRVIGGTDYLVCLPLAATTKKDLFSEAKLLRKLDPDLLEWRIDTFEDILDIEACLNTLSVLRTHIDDLPLIFTCRSKSEGGQQDLPCDHRKRLILKATQSDVVDIIDIEMANSMDYVEDILNSARQQQVKIILSHHDFQKTPDEKSILNTLFKARDMGADIAKMAVMPKSYDDVLTLLKATLKARESGLHIPIVTMAMGYRGRLTRIIGGFFGSDITFGCGPNPTAPGQIPVMVLKQAIITIYS